MRPWLALTAFAVAIAVPFSAPAEADAERGITTGLFASEYQSPDASVRDLWFGRTVDANANLVRIDVIWRSVVGSERPADPRDPADPAYDFSALDAAVGAAQQRGLRVLLTVYHAPDWAEGTERPAGVSPGAWRPDPAQYGNFGTALARRYSGGFPDPAGQGTLPRVRYFEALNEPNLEVFLAPQWVGDRAKGPAIYKELLNALYDAVNAVDPSNIVVSGGTTSFGDPPGGDRTRPITFLRKLFCLRGRRKPRPRHGCPKVHMDVLGHHPISTANPPTYSAVSPNDVAMSDIDALRRVLRAAEKGGVVRPGGKRSIWVTEFWWHAGVPVSKQARYVEQALYVLWRQRVEVAIHYLIRDFDPYQGLFFADGSEKPAFQAFRFPFVTERRSRKRLHAWGKPPDEGDLSIQVLVDGTWKALKRLSVEEGEVFETGLRLRGKAQLRAIVGDEQSIVWRQRR